MSATPATPDNFAAESNLSLAEKCKEAGLEIMEQVFDILHNRESVPESVLNAVTVQDIQNFYFDFIGPAIDRIEDALNDGAEDEEEPMHSIGNPACPAVHGGECPLPGHDPIDEDDEDRDDIEDGGPVCEDCGRSRKEVEVVARDAHHGDLLCDECDEARTNTNC